MKKLAFLVLLVCAMVLCFAACGKTPDATTTTTTTSTTTTASCAHEFSEWVILKDASCTEEGMQTRACELCKDGEYETIAAKGHTEVTLQAVAPTCTETGLSEGKKCSACNTTLVAQQTVAAKGHTEVIDQAVAPTCTATGLTEGKHCSVCNTTLVAQQTVAAKGHKDENNDRRCDVCHVFTYSEGLKYTLGEDGTYYILSGKGTCTDTEAFIPPTYNGLPVTSIGDYAFYYCDSLTSVEIPDSVTSIGDSAFDGCTSLTFNEYGNCRYLGNASNPYVALIEVTSQNLSSYDIHNDTRVIAGRAFSSCSRLASIIIPDSVTSIGDRAFSSCDSLTSVEIPDSVTSIGDWAFAYCDRLTSVVIGDSVTSIGDSAFWGCFSLTSFEIPNSVTSIGVQAFAFCDSLTNIEVRTSNAAYKSIDGNLYTKDGKTLIRYAIGKTATHFEIPSGVTSIGNYAFSSCTSLISIVIPDSVTSIGYQAFYYCRSLTSVTIPDSVTSIGDYAFYSCTSLTSVVIGNSVTSIGYEAFYYCDSLSDVYYTGTAEQWQQISIGSSNYNLTSATRHYNYAP